MLRNGEWRASAAAVALLASVGLASCGADEATDPSASEDRSSSTPSQEPASEENEAAPPGTPECSDIWQDGRRIPRFYAGCVDGDTFVERDGFGCSSGQRMVTYADRFYGVLGGTVNEVSEPLDQDPDYTASARRCRG